MLLCFQILLQLLLCFHSLFYSFRRKRAIEPFEPVVVENCWPTKKARINGRRRKRIVQTEDVPSESVLDAALPSDSVLDVVVQTDTILDAAVQTEAILDAAVQTEPILDAAVQTEDAPEDVMQAELNLSCVEVSTEKEHKLVRVDELHKPKQALGRVVGIPSPNDSKKTKSMKVLCPVLALPSGKKRKSYTCGIERKGSLVLL